jgi:hypothetical protein
VKLLELNMTGLLVAVAESEGKVDQDVVVVDVACALASVSKAEAAGLFKLQQEK